ncbi:MAG: 2-amino-4-hydroxy-6-hydroxymethyldihydropteridine diphosphokinase [Robiginitomaculum sp.]|nr:2-amino-4-hydroxy-6-hydroxymethyldihydropteridine diphosphokinase [Robiginitomaculum sp.]
MAVYVALGANQRAQYRGETVSPAETFLLAIARLQQNGVDVISASSLWQSPAWPDPSAQPPYINAVIGVETKLEPRALLTLLKKTEAVFGRVATQRNAPRPLDLDILDYHGQVINYDGRTMNKGETLTLPHPRMFSRAFVLMPLSEIAPDWADPIKKRAIAEWTARLALEDVAPLKRLGALL